MRYGMILRYDTLCYELRQGQHIPDGRWRLFMHEVNAELDRGESMVVVLAAVGLTPIDAVSGTNVYDLEVNDFDGTAVISSYAIDRRMQRPYLHTERFRQEGVQATTPNNSATNSVTLNISWWVKEC